MAMTSETILSHLKRLGDMFEYPEEVELLLIGGAAGILTKQLNSTRATMDCDVIRIVPSQAEQAILQAARTLAEEQGLPEPWLNLQAKPLDILPDGWQVRKVHIGSWGKLHVCALSRRDLLATKFYAGSPRDVQDISDMNPTAEELAFVRTYLDMLRVPSRQAHLDQLARSENLLAAWGGEADGSAE